MDHRLTAMMPGAFDDAPEGGKTVCMADLDQMVMDGMLIDAELAKKGVQFVVLPARYKQLLPVGRVIFKIVSRHLW